MLRKIAFGCWLIVVGFLYAFAATQFTVQEQPEPPSNACFADGCDCRPNCFCAECECGE